MNVIFVEYYTYHLTLIDFSEQNANHIILSYCHLTVTCRRTVDRYGSHGGCKSQIFNYTFHSFQRSKEKTHEKGNYVSISRN